jgi:hypothetical protein
MKNLMTTNFNNASELSGIDEKIAECRALICDPDRDLAADAAQEADEFGSVEILNKFRVDKGVYDFVIGQFEARRILLASGHNYTALELCGPEGSGYFSAAQWEQIADTCLRHHARHGGGDLKEFKCPECKANHGFHIVNAS